MARTLFLRTYDKGLLSTKKKGKYMNTILRAHSQPLDQTVGMTAAAVAPTWGL